MDWMKELEAKNGAKDYLITTYGPKFKDKVNPIPLLNAFVEGWNARDRKELYARVLELSENDSKRLVDALPESRNDRPHLTSIFGFEIRINAKIPEGVGVMLDGDGEVVGLVNFK